MQHTFGVFSPRRRAEVEALWHVIRTGPIFIILIIENDLLVFVVDFEDLRSVINFGSGVAMIGLGAASGPGRAEAATMEALHSPLLDIDTSDARGALINVVGGANLTLGEAERCAKIIKDQISPHAQIIWGAAVKEELEEEIRVMLVLTGVKSEQIHGASENRQLRALRNQQIEFVN